MKSKLVKESLNEYPDQLMMREIEIFMERLDFARQSMDGHRVLEDEIEEDLIEDEFRPGYEILRDNPEILETPEVEDLLSEWEYKDIRFDEDGTVYVTYY